MARILVVDDDPDFVEIVRVLLQSRGYYVDTAGDAEGAFRVLEAHAPDLILLDMMISFALDGYVIARRIRDSSLWRDTPILVTSSLTQAQCSDMCPGIDQIAIDGWITKPVHPANLFQQIELALSQPSSAR
jgi:CheY-like chemotaxis protein